MFAPKSKELFREVNLSVPFRSLCYNCRKPLDFADRKYVNLNSKSGYYYCEECKRQVWKHSA